MLHPVGAREKDGKVIEETTVRLSCPTCDAVYEVPAAAIPASGRDVQCSNCGTVWFQRSGQAPAPPSAAALDPSTSHRRSADEDRPRPPLSDEGRQILMEEAERERNLRQGRTSRASREREVASAVESLLDDDGRPATSVPPSTRGGSATEPGSAPQSRPASTVGKRVADPEPEPTAEPAEEIAARPSRRDRFPDIAEVNSSLGQRGGVEEQRADDAPRPEVQGSGFRLGFALALILAAVGLILYVQADRIGEAVPALDRPLGAYRDGVNEIRIALDGLARQAAASLER